MKAAVITFPGSNNDDDCVYALTVAGFSVDKVWHKDTPDLTVYDFVLIPGGFSFGDYLRCGAIASLSPIMEKIRAYAEGGKLLMGLCNGFQILCEARLLPGALARNRDLLFICRDVKLKVQSTHSPFTCAMQEGEVVTLPIAHGEGRYVVSDPDFAELKKNNQILFSYVDDTGKESDGANPNGSVHHIAGVCNLKRNVFGMMPHPDRATDMRSKDGKKFWQSVIQTLAEKRA